MYLHALAKLATAEGFEFRSQASESDALQLSYSQVQLNVS